MKCESINSFKHDSYICVNSVFFQKRDRKGLALLTCFQHLWNLEIWSPRAFFMNPDTYMGVSSWRLGPWKRSGDKKSLTPLCCAFPTRQPEGTKKNEPLSPEQSPIVGKEESESGGGSHPIWWFLGYKPSFWNWVGQEGNSFLSEPFLKHSLCTRQWASSMQEVVLSPALKGWSQPLRLYMPSSPPA